VKLLLDENLSYRIVDAAKPLYLDSSHVRLLGLQKVDDAVIWDYAGTNDYVIVSKDSDFHQRSFVLGYPPKVIWVRCGNCSTDQIVDLLRNNHAAIQEFHDDIKSSFLVLGSFLI
jgi:predicted nuclease of predicted toxin-antitoxin system